MPWYEYSPLPGRETERPYLRVRLWHGNKWIQIIAKVDSGADDSVIDLSVAEFLGLNRDKAKVDVLGIAGGLTTAAYRWEDNPIELQFQNQRFPFTGIFVEVASDADHENLLGRGDFFKRFTVQFWEEEKVMNIDTSPDYPRKQEGEE